MYKVIVYKKDPNKYNGKAYLVCYKDEKPIDKNGEIKDFKSFVEYWEQSAVDVLIHESQEKAIGELAAHICLFSSNRHFDKVTWKEATEIGIQINPKHIEIKGCCAFLKEYDDEVEIKFVQIVEDSQFFTNLQQILSYVKSSKIKDDYLRIALENTIKNDSCSSNKFYLDRFKEIVSRLAYYGGDYDSDTMKVLINDANQLIIEYNGNN